jgi:hypothetical protein
LDSQNASKIKRPVGRPPTGWTYTARVTVPMAQSMLDRIDATRGPDERRIDFIRYAIDQELQRREKD